ncbi:hypothetical protein Ciccas_006436 [Cichlidogyrus casuarinus]|uniref:Uncharacterized protein n=1 Tax=Cichlidogyrus casuarinus TaxID=1844966 RepID=A0ABD2Q5R3_9PLAT
MMENVFLSDTPDSVRAGWYANPESENPTRLLNGTGMAEPYRPSNCTQPKVSEADSCSSLTLTESEPSTPTSNRNRNFYDSRDDAITLERMKKILCELPNFLHGGHNCAATREDARKRKKMGFLREQFAAQFWPFLISTTTGTFFTPEVESLNTSTKKEDSLRWYETADFSEMHLRFREEKQRQRSFYAEMMENINSERQLIPVGGLSPTFDETLASNEASAKKPARGQSLATKFKELGNKVDSSKDPEIGAIDMAIAKGPPKHFPLQEFDSLFLA